MGLLFANRSLTALPPIWLFCAGSLLAAVVAVLFWAVLKAVAPKVANELRASLSEGFLGPMAWLLMGLSAVAVALTPLVPLDQMARSLNRLVTAGEETVSLEVPANSELQSYELDLRPQELASFAMESDRQILVRTQQPIAGFALMKVPDVDLLPATPWEWVRSEGDTSPFLGVRAKLEVTNASSEPATLVVRSTLVPEYPEVAILPWTVIVVLSILAFHVFLRTFLPRVAAVAAVTAKEAVAQPIFLVALVLGTVAIITFIVIPYNTFGEDVKMFKDSGLTLIKVLSLLVVIWTASLTVAEEIEGRTALTVLSKPLNRQQFVIGKYVGLMLAVLLIVLLLGSVLMASTSFKVIYDARESSATDPIWRDCANEMITIVPGLTLSFLEASLLAAVSVAVSTRLGLVPNMIICFAVYTLGHLVPLVVQSSVGKFAIVRFVGQFFATLLPVLDHFTIEAAVVGGVPVPWSYLGWAAIYAGLYATVALLVALVLFQDRDLA
jgi:ABC-type transport system involved in multi-copper enzyme maturation permease subunit